MAATCRCPLSRIGRVARAMSVGVGRSHDEVMQALLQACAECLLQLGTADVATPNRRYRPGGGTSDWLQPSTVPSFMACRR